MPFLTIKSTFPLNAGLPGAHIIKATYHNVEEKAKNNCDLMAINFVTMDETELWDIQPENKEKGVPSSSSTSSSSSSMNLSTVVYLGRTTMR